MGNNLELNESDLGHLAFVLCFTWEYPSPRCRVVLMNVAVWTVPGTRHFGRRSLNDVTCGLWVVWPSSFLQTQGNGDVFMARD